MPGKYVLNINIGPAWRRSLDPDSTIQSVYEEFINGGVYEGPNSPEDAYDYRISVLTKAEAARGLEALSRLEGICAKVTKSDSKSVRRKGLRIVK